jgi:DNA excision repair protein ERCC-4
MLHYEKTAATEILRGGNSLAVFSRGLDLGSLVAIVAAEKLLLSEGRPILALNFPKTVFQRLGRLLATHPAKFPIHLLPRHVSSSVSAVERFEVYGCGGIIAATPRTLAVDLLTAVSHLGDHEAKKVPTLSFLGILIYNAHEISEHRSETFVTRLFREYVGRCELEDTFIHAFSDAAPALCRGFHSAEKLMRLLGLERLLLYPRFHVDVVTSLEHKTENPQSYVDGGYGTHSSSSAGIELLELHQPMTALMKAIQDEILVLMRSCFFELRRSSPAAELDESDLRVAATSRSILQAAQRIGQEWRRLNSRSRQLLQDIQNLNSILSSLLDDDCVTFLAYLESLRDTQGATSLWMAMESAQNLYRLARERVFRGTDTGGDSKLMGMQDAALDLRASETGELPFEFSQKLVCPEPNSKWELLKELLDEVVSMLMGHQRHGNVSDASTRRVLVLGREPCTIQFLAEYLHYREGAFDALHRRLLLYLGTKSGGKARESVRATTATVSKAVPSLRVKSDDIDASQSSSNAESEHSSACTDMRQHAPNQRITAEHDSPGQKFGHLQGDAAGHASPRESASDNYNSAPAHASSAVSQCADAARVEILLKSYGRRQSSTGVENLIGPSTILPFLLDSQPCSIILLDPTLQHVREIEVYQAAYSRFAKIRVYAVFYEESPEYELYCNAIADEKHAFQTLIRHKASMAVRLDQSSAVAVPDTGPERIYWPLWAGSLAKADRPSPSSGRPQILVDVREFRSTLPGCLYQAGFELLPRTLKVGDYVLTPDICVERKSIPDLTSSLASGRLYTQCQAMCRLYRYPLLMIELQEDDIGSTGAKAHVTNLFAPSLSFQENSSHGPATGIGKLCLLTIHFPRLRLLWCRGPQAGAEVFGTLKIGEAEPSGEPTGQISGESEATEDSSAEASLYSVMNARDAFAMRPFDMLRCLPGVENATVFALMRQFRTLTDLANAEADNMAKHFGPTLAKQLISFINTEFRDPNEVSASAAGAEPVSKKIRSTSPADL